MNTPNSHTRFAYVDHQVTAGGATLDLYPPPHGKGWWTPADPIFDIAGIAEADRTDFRQRHGMTNSVSGFEIAWDGLRPQWKNSVALLSRHAVGGVLAHAVQPLDPAIVVAIDAALAG